jgi:hypothetical protein
MTKHNSRGVAAYDPRTGDILHIHFTASQAPIGGPDHAETMLRRLVAHHGPDIGIVHLPAGSHAPGQRLRVDLAAGTIRHAERGERGFSAAAGSTRPHRP